MGSGKGVVDGGRGGRKEEEERGDRGRRVVRTGERGVGKSRSTKEGGMGEREGRRRKD